MPIIIQPAGLSAAGTFTAVEFVSPAKPPAILADAINVRTGEYDSIISGLHPVDAAVVTRIRTVRSSGASVRSVGHRFDRVKKIDDSYETAIRYEAEEVFADLVTRGDIRVDKIAIDQESDTGSVFFSYTNLRTNVATKNLRLT
jgi:hypothetical protein